MSISKDPVEGNDAQVKSNGHSAEEIQSDGSTTMRAAPALPKISLDTSSTVTNNAADPTAEFIGEVDTDNTIPSQGLLRKVANYQVLDRDGRSRPFKSLYSGPMVPRRVLVIFVRHFFCGVRYLFLLPPLSRLRLLHTEIYHRIAKNTSVHCPKI
jgi:hypothetical protein